MSDALDYACRLLARREHSVGELRRKLETKWPGEDSNTTVIDQLVEEGSLSDRRFAAAFVRSRVARLQGPRKIRAELLRRSVSDLDFEEAARELDTSWTDLALEWLSRQSGDGSDYESRAKYYRRLVNRGFTHDQAMDALNRWNSRSDGV